MTVESIAINVDLRSSKPFRHFYDAVGYANSDFTYTEPSKRMYDYLTSFSKHFRYMRLHNILTAHGRGDYYLEKEHRDYGNPEKAQADTVVSLDDEGRLKFDWTNVDRVYDILAEHGIRPIVETVYMPSCLRLSEEFSFIPKDYHLWAQTLTAFVGHLQDRYGKEEIRNWYFEVWNEPDNHALWVENPETFFALYDYTEAAIHQADEKIKVGGPATKQWEGAYSIFDKFLHHCTSGLNYATGRFGTRLDFISVHCKGGFPNFNCPSTRVMFDSLDSYLQILKKYPMYAQTEFINDESDIVWNGNLGTERYSWLNFRNTHYAPGFTCKMISTYCSRIEDDGGVNLSIVDSDNCHIHWEKSLFSGNRSQLTPLVSRGSTDLIRKPVSNAYVLLSRLGDRRSPVSCDQSGFGDKYGILATTQADSIALMLWNFEDGVDDSVNARKFSLRLTDIPFHGAYNLVHYRIDSHHSSSYAVWEQQGKPENPSVEQIKAIRSHEGLELYEDPRSIRLTESFAYEVEMPMHAVSLLLLLPQNMKKPAQPVFRKSKAEKGVNGNLQIYLYWKPDDSFDFLYYRIWRKKAGERDFTLICDQKSVNTSIYVDMDIEADETYQYKIQSVNAAFIQSDFSETITVTLD